MSVFENKLRVFSTRHRTVSMSKVPATNAVFGTLPNTKTSNSGRCGLAADVRYGLNQQ